MIDLLADFCARERVPGAVVCAFDSDGPTALGCHGVTDIESRTPLSPSTMFRIYSVSKLLTACVVVGLARRGLLDLDAPVDDYLDGLRRRGDSGMTMTVRQALSHTGGLVPDSLTWAALGRNDADLETDIVRDYARAFSFAAPGLHYGYANASFNLAAVLIQRLTGSSFADAMRSSLFDPVGMPVTTHDPVVAMTYPLAQHHEVVDGELRVIHRPLAGSKWLAGSQCYSTLTEMACLGSWLLRDLRSGSVDGRAGVDQPVADLRLDVGTHYGLGCYLTPAADGAMVVGHEGFFEGMWIKLVLDPARDRGIIWMDNRGDEIRDARYQVIDELLPGLLPCAAGRADLGFGTQPPEIPGSCVAGVYQRLGSPSLTIEADGEDLVLSLEGRRRRLHPFSRGIWRDPATAEDTGTWRPHAGSAQVCLGAADRDPDGTQVAHLNAIPYSRTG
jgi:CubicO group peptidase (beta-lactamase class C family)